MFTIYVLDGSEIFVTGFKKYSDAQYYALVFFGPGNFEIEFE